MSPTGNHCKVKLYNLGQNAGMFVSGIESKCFCVCCCSYVYTAVLYWLPPLMCEGGKMKNITLTVNILWLQC